jgi:hypothetical protein
MDPQCTAIPVCQNLKITASLRRFYDSKCVFLFGHRNIDRVVTSDLKKDSGVGSALISLARGMLKTRAKFRAGGNSLFIANGVADRLQSGLMCVVPLDVGENRKVIAGAEAVQMSA